MNSNLFLKTIKNILLYLHLFGINPLQTIRAIKALPRYLYDLKRLKNSAIIVGGGGGDMPFKKLYPCLFDKSTNGSVGGHYFHQDLLVARRVFLNNPQRHIDVGSRIDGFVAHVASFRQIQIIDIRPLPCTIPNISYIQQDFMIPVKEALMESCDSLSCLHALEHFGLGRYGDPLNYGGYLCGLDNLYRILRKQGTLYLSVPIGLQRIEFNAHRVFSVKYLLSLFEGKYHIDQFSFVDDKGDLHENIQLQLSDIENNFGCNYGCGIFEMTKL
jgi:hypothetical protein